MMAHYRCAEPQHVSCSLRISLDQSQHASVDAVLKDLKIHSRRLQLVLAAHTDEHQILERLYYKGKNQHRGALFWRRVVEIRRYCDRLNGVRIDNVVNVLRCSFFGEDACSNLRVLKGSWTHFPDAQSIKSVLERLSAASELVEKMRLRLMDAYRSFTLAMQSGAFLQLMLTLVAIASRMGVISSELCDALQLISKTTQRMLLIFESPLSEPDQTSVVAVDNGYLAGAFEVSTTAETESPLIPFGTSSFSSSEIRKPAHPHDIQPLSSASPVSRVVIQRRTIPDASQQLVAAFSENTLDNGSGKKGRRKIRKATKNEIDDIFGF